MTKLEPWQAMRRARAILAAGWTVQQLAIVLGTTDNILWTALRSPEEWRQYLDSTSEIVDRIYRRIETEPVTQAEYLVAKTRWKTPLMWDNIDDPDEAPKVSTVWADRRRNPAIPFPAEIHRLLHIAVARKGTIRELAECIGMNVKTLERITALEPGGRIREETLDKLSCRLLRAPLCTEVSRAA